MSLSDSVPRLLSAALVCLSAVAAQAASPVRPVAPLVAASPGPAAASRWAVVGRAGDLVIVKDTSGEVRVVAEGSYIGDCRVTLAGVSCAAPGFAPAAPVTSAPPAAPATAVAPAVSVTPAAPVSPVAPAAAVPLFASPQANRPAAAPAAGPVAASVPGQTRPAGLALIRPYTVQPAPLPAAAPAPAAPELLALHGYQDVLPRLELVMSGKFAAPVLKQDGSGWSLLLPGVAPAPRLALPPPPYPSGLEAVTLNRTAAGVELKLRLAAGRPAPLVSASASTLNLLLATPGAEAGPALAHPVRPLAAPVAGAGKLAVPVPPPAVKSSSVPAAVPAELLTRYRELFAGRVATLTAEPWAGLPVRHFDAAIVLKVPRPRLAALLVEVGPAVADQVEDGEVVYVVVARARLATL